VRYLVTGDAGFVGFHVALRLLDAGNEVLGLDGMTDYYDVDLKYRRLALLAERPRFKHVTMMLEDHGALMDTFANFLPEVVVHLAAQAGVRYSVDHPRAYLSSNIVGTFNVLEACRAYPITHLLLASTSSAYGANDKYPFEERDPAVHPVTLYAASKASTELMAHSYAHLFGTPTTAFRFFTVYGPWGRPDMAYFLFTKKILEGKPIDVFNNGESWRDFTYIDDLVDSITRLAEKAPPVSGAREGLAPIPGDTLSPVAPYRLVNIGAGQPAKLTDLIDEIEGALGIQAVRVLKPLPPGDIVRTFANADLLFGITGQKPSTPLSVGVPAFVKWYRQHYN
jgi:UDP-glucuronate 4-epimerase